MEPDEQGLFFPIGLDLNRLRGDFREATDLGRGFGRTLSRAFTDVAIKGRSLSSVLSGVFRSLSRQALTAAVKPVESEFGALFKNTIGSVFSARGFTGSAGGVTPFARGGVINAPALFPLGAGGAGLMGEAGPEAILPLTRSPDGNLGVRAESGGQITINFNVNAPDPQAFMRSEGQVTAMMNRALIAARRNL